MLASIAAYLVGQRQTQYSTSQSVKMTNRRCIRVDHVVNHVVKGYVMQSKAMRGAGLGDTGTGSSDSGQSRSTYDDDSQLVYHGDRKQS